MDLSYLYDNRISAAILMNIGEVKNKGSGIGTISSTNIKD